MFQEEKNVGQARPDERPPDLGYSLIFRSTDPSGFLERFRDVWRVVASWGRFCDDDAGDWPTEEECLASLPLEFSSSLTVTRKDDISGWLDDVHDRDWVLWSSALVGRCVKIDLSSKSMPISTWPIRLVAEIVGATIIYADLWRQLPMDGQECS